MNALLISLILINFTGVLVTLAISLSARRTMEKVRLDNERARQRMYEAAIESGSVVVLHPEAYARTRKVRGRKREHVSA